MIKVFKITVVNILIGLFFLSTIELIFGYWFDEDNLGPYVREYRMRKNTYVVTYEEKKYEFVYKRNYYGFRGDEVSNDKISAVLIGGSTTDERYKPAEFTITELINKKISHDKKNIKLFNAGIEGQSTRGHIANLRFWFPKLKKFQPKYLIYYVGINDMFYGEDKPDTFFSDGVVLESNRKQRIWDNIKSRSIFYDLTRKSKHRFYTSDKKILYDFDKGIKKYQKMQKTKFVSYKDFIKKSSYENVLKIKNHKTDNYLSRIDTLYQETLKLGAIPIFINQLASSGFENKRLITLNTFLINHCKEKKYYCIDLAKELEADYDYWWDGVHTTPKGSEAIASIIAPKLIKIFNNN